MQNGHLSLAAGTCLISELLKKLSDGPALTNLNIVLPTQRLCLFLSRELALKGGGSAVLPRLWTWERFVDEIMGDYLDNNSVMVSTQAELIMEYVIEDLMTQAQRPLHVNIRHAHELVHLSAELARSGEETHARGRLLEYLEGDWRRSGEVLAHLQHRVDEVFLALERYQATLASLGWKTREQLRSSSVKRWLAASIDEQQKSLPLGPVLIAGLTSLPPIETKLLAALSKLENVSIWLDEPPGRSESAPLQVLRQQVGLPLPHCPQQSWAPGVQQITGCSDITHEVSYVFEQVRSLVESGIAAHEIAIIVPDEEQYAPALSALSKSLGVEINIPLASSWSNSGAGRWLRLVTTLGRGNEIHGFGQYILSPTTKFIFDAPDSFDDGLFQKELKKLPAFGFDGASICEHYLRKLDRASGEFIQRAVQWCFRSDDKDINAANDRLFAVLDKMLGGVAKDSYAGTEKKSIELVLKSAQQVAELDLIRKFTPKQWRNHLENIYRIASQESLRETGEPLSGIQIIGLTEARYIPFSKVFIVGCVEGSFPHSLPRDSLIDNQMRRAMGLPGWNELEALEDATFHLLTSRLPHIELTYAQWDAETPLIRSRWIEMLASKVDVKLLDPSDQSSNILCHKGKASLRETNTSKNDSREGLVPDAQQLTASTSASRLRNLLWCPYRYLLQARRVEAVELPDDRAHLETGDWLHKVLEKFFDENDRNLLPESLQWRSKPVDPSSFGAWAHDRLDAIARKIIPLDLLRSPQFQHMTGSGWENIANFWQSLFSAGWSPDDVSTEVSFGKASKLSLSIGGRPIEVHGTVDALHTSHKAGPLIMDYKTSTVPAASLIAEGLEPQLPLYAKALTAHGLAVNPNSLCQDLEQVAIGYYNLSEGKASFVAVGETAKTDLIAKGLLSNRHKPASLADAYTAVEERWDSRLSEIVSKNQFAADPSDCSMCSYAGICRKDDPRYRDAIAGQQVALANDPSKHENGGTTDKEGAE